MSVRARVSQVLDSPRVAPAALLLALMLTVPALTLGFYSDDYAFVGALRNLLPYHVRADQLYGFIPGDGSHPVDHLPWWSAPGLKLYLVRPLSSMLFALDHRLFGDNAVLYHLHSSLWFLLTCVSAHLWFRQLVGRKTAILALLIYVLAPGQGLPFAWLASRHVLVAAAPAFFGMYLYVRAREAKRAPWMALVCFAIALLGSEAGIAAIVYAVCYELLGVRDVTVGTRVRAAAPSVLLAVVYLGLYKLAGGGTRGGDGYLDPLSDPIGFARAAVYRVPAVVGSALHTLPAELSLATSKELFAAVGAVAAAVVFGVFVLARPAIDARDQQTLRWMMPAAVVTIIASAGGFPGARQLVIAEASFSVLLALLLRAALEGQASRLLTVSGWGIAFVHIIFAGLAQQGGIASTKDMRAKTSAVVRSMQPTFTKGTHAFVVSSDPMLFMYAPLMALVESPEHGSCWSVLSAAPQAHLFKRVAPNQLELTIVGGHLGSAPFESIYRTARIPFRSGETVTRCGAKIQVDAVENGFPTKLRITFERPLDDASIVLYAWKDSKLQRVVLAREGETLEVPWKPGPSGIF